MSYGKDQDHQLAILDFEDDPKIADAIAPYPRERSLQGLAFRSRPVAVDDIFA